MNSLLYIRQKTGLSQQQLADYLDVSRSTLSMAELDLRPLPTEALRKLADIDNALTNTLERKVDRNNTSEYDSELQKLTSHHQGKIDLYLLRVKKFEKDLSNAIQSQQQADAKLILADSLRNEAQSSPDDNPWINYLHRKGNKITRQNASKIQRLKINIELYRGYAAVHEKILAKLKGEA